MVNRTTGIIQTVVGIGSCSQSSGEGVLATTACIMGLNSIAFDSSGNLYFTDFWANLIRKVNTSGYVSTVVGMSTTNANWHLTPAFVFPFNNSNQGSVYNVALDASGNLYFNDISMYNGGYATSVIIKMTPAGVFSIFAGTNGTTGYSGDGGPATNATLQVPAGMRFDSAGNLLFADSYNNVIRKVASPSGVITTVAGSYTNALVPGNNNFPLASRGLNGPVMQAHFAIPTAVAFDASNNMYICDSYDASVAVVNASGTVSCVVGCV